MKQPQLSLKIRLYAVGPKGGHWNDEQLNFLFEELGGKTVYTSIPNCYQRHQQDCLIAQVFLPSK